MRLRILILIVVLAGASIGIYFFTLDRSSGPRIFRLIDHFQQIEFVEGNPAHGGNPSSSGHDAELQQFISDKMNHDAINGSPVHPLKLKLTKDRTGPGQGFGLRTENAIFAPPKTVFRYTQKIGSQPSLHFGYGLVMEDWRQTQGAVIFRVTAESRKKRSRKVLFTDRLQSARSRDRAWQKRVVDLADFANREVSITFETVPAEKNHPKGFNAAWLNPAIVENSRNQKKMNLLLISIDTLRSDHLGCYGYPKNTTPLIDSLAKEGVLFKNTIAQAPYTMSSHMSLLTSLYPSFHGVNKLQESYLDSKISTLAETLYNQGYRTWAITGGGQLSYNYGFAEGFETFIEYNQRLDVERKVGEAIEFMEMENGNPFFIFFHTFRPHAPYRAPEGYVKMFDQDYSGPVNGMMDSINDFNDGTLKLTPRDLQRYLGLYDAEIRQTDDALVPLFKYLKSKRLDENTLVVITSDHGEEFGEHGKVALHSHTLYDELLRIPLIFHGPRLPKGKVVEDQVRSVDIAPTILHLLGVMKADGMQGSSLVNLIQSSESRSAVENYAFSERLAADGLYFRSIRSQGFKFIYGADQTTGSESYSYFDLRKDPSEQKNVYAPPVGNKLMSHIQFLIQHEESSQKVVRQKDLDPETLETLKALGYIN